MISFKKVTYQFIGSDPILVDLVFALSCNMAFVG